MNKFEEHKNAYVVASSGENFSRKEFYDWSLKKGYTMYQATKVIKTMSNKVSHGIYSFANVTPFESVKKAKVKPVAAEHKVTSIVSENVYIPKKIPEFVKWGFYADVKKIINSKLFFPVYVSGLSGNGKTIMIEQACAEAKREYVRVQITPETDEDDLIGGFRLINGETVFAKGPVIKAMEAGAILLIDEIDRGSNKLMSLQGVLEGNPVMIKKTGEVVEPAKGFNVIATANTKGQGDESGRFISATIIDEAFLERFNITLEQPYASDAIERKIIMNHMTKYDCVDKEFGEKLVLWGQAIRKTFTDGGVDDMISTRRMCHIVQTYSIFNDRMKSIELCINRFEMDTREAFLDLYTKIDATVSTEETDATEETAGVPF